MWMARKTQGSRAKKERLLSEYKKANAERRRILNYLKATEAVLAKPERDLLSEFLQLAKRRCDRLRRAIQQSSNQHAA